MKQRPLTYVLCRFIEAALSLQLPSVFSEPSFTACPAKDRIIIHPSYLSLRTISENIPPVGAVRFVIEDSDGNNIVKEHGCQQGFSSPVQLDEYCANSLYFVKFIMYAILLPLRYMYVMCVFRLLQIMPTRVVVFARCHCTYILIDGTIILFCQLSLCVHRTAPVFRFIYVYMHACTFQ